MEQIIQALEAEKARIEKELDRIDRLIALAGSGVPQGARKVGKPKAGKIRRGKGGHGKLKEAIVTELRAAGPKGISMKEIAARTGVPYSHLGPWLATTGKHINEIVRLDRGVYTWQNGPTKEAKKKL